MPAPSHGSTAPSRARQPQPALASAPDTIALATAEASSGSDLILDRPSRFGLGFQLTQPERRLGPNPGSFGHFGAGGSLGFADPEAGLAFAYTPNQGLGRD